MSALETRSWSLLRPTSLGDPLMESLSTPLEGLLTSDWRRLFEGFWRLEEEEEEGGAIAFTERLVQDVLVARELLNKFFIFGSKCHTRQCRCLKK